MTIVRDDNAPCGTANRKRVSRNRTDIKKKLWTHIYTKYALTLHLYLRVDIEGELGAYWKRAR